MNHFEIGLLVWAIFTTLASVYELFIIICNDMDSDAIQVKNKRIVELSEKLTKIEKQNLELESQIRELKEKANKQPVKAKVRRKEKKKMRLDIDSFKPQKNTFYSIGVIVGENEDKQAITNIINTIQDACDAAGAFCVIYQKTEESNKYDVFNFNAQPFSEEISMTIEDN